MRYRGGGSGSAPSPVCTESERQCTQIEKFNKKKQQPQTHVAGATAEWPARRHCSWQQWLTWHLRSRLSTMWFHSRTRCLDWVFFPLPSDVHCKAKSSLTVTFVRCQSDASHTDVQFFYLFFSYRTAEDTTATLSSELTLLCHVLKREGQKLPKLENYFTRLYFWELSEILSVPA